MVDLETNSEENIREDEKRSLCCKIKCATPFCRMDMFSIIKQSIYAEDTNPITRYFQIGRQVGSCGPEMIWKIYEAIRISDQKVSSLFLHRLCSWYNWVLSQYDSHHILCFSNGLQFSKVFDRDIECIIHFSNTRSWRFR